MVGIEESRTAAAEVFYKSASFNIQKGICRRKNRHDKDWNDNERDPRG